LRLNRVDLPAASTIARVFFATITISLQIFNHFFALFKNHLPLTTNIFFIA